MQSVGMCQKMVLPPKQPLKIVGWILYRVQQLKPYKVEKLRLILDTLNTHVALNQLQQDELEHISIIVYKLGQVPPILSG